jgi:hypothetical protein
VKLVEDKSALAHKVIFDPVATQEPIESTMSGFDFADNNVC